MQIDRYVTQVQSQLVAAASLGDDSTQAIARALSETAEAVVRLAIVSAVSEATNEVTAALLDQPGAPAVSTRMEGDEILVEVRPTHLEDDPEDNVPGPANTAADATDESDNSARITLRLSESLKSRIEGAARQSGLSVNTWLLHAASNSLSGGQWRRGPRRPGWSGFQGQHMTGWINS